VSEGASDRTRFVRATFTDLPLQPAGVTATAFDQGDVSTLLGLS
jgi:hypothetical protein